MTSAMKYMVLNGELVPENTTHPLFNNRGFYYGDGFFESMRFFDGKILLSDLHMQRLHRSLLLLEMNPEGFPDINTLESIIDKVVNKNEIGKHGRARLSVFRSAPGNYTPDENKTSYLLNISSLDGPYSLPEKGFTAGIFTRQAKARGPLSAIKSLSSQLYVMAALHARKQNWDESIIVNTSGHLIEATTSNLFLYYNHTLITPALSEGCIDGVFRKYILDLADKNGIPFREQIITETELSLADEVLLTNGIRGIQFVEKIGDKGYGKKMATELHQLILKAVFGGKQR